MRHKTIVALTCAAAFMLGVLASTQASAANYGPSGLGANLHRRHVMKQATRRARAGLPVRRSAIVWMAGPRATAWWGR